ncbi:DUF397 domain-containing protein [Actinophytocola sp.]|uniref:DUF397 domain-containing protein n=1 Tax=Actinophytocola sp. TaxID=1872138 RepID=UPI002D80E1D6|nr:DUF397 domain-containing protein [Actinophytocola sp.]
MTLVPDPALIWHKSSMSGPTNGGCVEVAWPAPLVAVRDSKHLAGPTLSFPRPSWSTFLRQPQA